MYNSYERKENKFGFFKKAQKLGLETGW